MKLVCKMISTVDYHVFGYEITMYYYAIHWELSFVRYIGAVHWGRYGRGLAMKLAMTDRGQPPLFMAYWLWAAVYLFVVVADVVAAGPGVPLNFALCMPAALAAVPGFPLLFCHLLLFCGKLFLGFCRHPLDRVHGMARGVNSGRRRRTRIKFQRSVLI